MALWSRKDKAADAGSTQVISDLRMLLASYDLVDVQDTYLVVAEKPKQLALQDRKTQELGTSRTNYSRLGPIEYNSKWIGYTGLRLVDEMR